MKNLAVIDIGGTSIKFGAWVNNELITLGSEPTPDNIASFYKILKHRVDEIKATYADISGVAISSPGAVNKEARQIDGASAIRYIHGFPIFEQLETLFDLPVSIENDANCAALAEVANGAGKDNKNVLFLVLGTGIGGAIIIDGKIFHGSHLYGGEFGFMLVNDHETLSEACSPVNLARKYNEITGEGLTGKEVFDLADQGNQIAYELREKMLKSLAVSIYNLQYSYDPEKFILGGGVSNNPRLLPLLKKKIHEMVASVPIAEIEPEVELCQFKSNANLYGAVVDFLQEHK
ncbi:ROK family protein [Lactobacillus gigeriorum]|uniref:ROK family sugar kinase n=1 Tax=Lactobacillus gigeriorum DSM 23908 = CRBIP 24.85 TaxID=1423751 RepID=I7LC99_9LACO|nr:ROK family protein [Lactobacillus gigeriorum]KRN12530.1 ROK family sugar kinase [Lactobacillus gigeriorum DSM 23908 = CRBIP 24.85]CCI86306.1 G2SQS9 (ROK family sugar kinase) [Lactobacillus gigeriorum DSM 23908 = CRBIP 24.85]